jgi:hypothetical protein
MRTTKSTTPDRSRDRLLALLLIIALGALMMAGLSACGSEATTEDAGGETTTEASGGGSESGVAGTYKVESTTEEGMDAFTLALKDDGTFTLTQPDPDGGEDVGIGGTYTVEGDKISLTNDEGSESDAGTVEADKLVFETITWVKQ